MNFSRRSRPASAGITEDSFVISDSDEEAESLLKKSVTTIRDPKVIGDSDSEDESSHNAESSRGSHDNDSESIASEEEDLQFMNASHKVSIIETSEEESESDHEPKFEVNKLKRRSIYENPRDSPRSESTPVNIRKKSRRAIILSDDSDSENIPANNQNSSLHEKSRKSLTYGNKSHNESSMRERREVKSDHSSINISDVDSEVAQNPMEVSMSSVNDEHDSEQKNNSSARENVSNKNSDQSYEPESDFSRSSNASDFVMPTNSKHSDNRSSIAKARAKKNVIDLTMNDPPEDSPTKGKNNTRIKNEKIDLTLDKPANSSHRENVAKKLMRDGNADDSEIVIDSSTNSSDNEVDPEAAVFAKKEIGVGNIDPIEAQKKEHLLLSIAHKQEQLNKLNKFAASVDIQRLPDKGAKVHESIRAHEEELKVLKEKLEKLTRKTRSNTPLKIQKPSTPSVKVEPKSSSYKNDSFDSPLNRPQIKKESKRYISPEDSDEEFPKRNLPTLKKEMKKEKKPEINNKFDDFDIKEIPNVPQDSFDPAELGKKALATLHKQQSLTHQRIEQLHGSLTSRPAEDVREKDPYGLNIALMAHQQHALAWMRWREKQKPKGGILADDMGLGKTLTMISLVLTGVNEKDSDDDSSDDEWYSKNTRKRRRGGTLVVCPASLLRQWEAEVKNRVRKSLLSVLVYHGNNRNIEERKLAKYNIVVTTYQILVREEAGETGLYKMEWNRVILDEAHYIRNHKSKACLAVSGLNAKNRWALTGTPIQNKEADLYAILKFLKCSPFDDFQVWKRWVENKSDAGRQRLITIMKTIMLRRTKQELQAKGSLESLPDKFSEIVEIDMDKEETLAYQKILLFSQNLFAQFLSQRAEKAHVRELHGGKFDKFYGSHGAKTQFTKAQKVLLNHHQDVEAHEILVLLLRLRQMCCHPALIHAMLDKNDAEVSGLYEEEEVNTDLLNKLKNMSMNDEDEGEIEEHVKNFEIDEKITSNLLTKKNPVFDEDRQGSKIRAIMKTIEEIIDKGDKLIVVSQWSSFLKVIAKNLDYVEDAKYDMFTGEVAVKNRQAIIDKFNNPREATNVLLLSLTAGGVGLNLVGANHLLLVDIHWNPQLESQAQDRIYRFGQKKNVHVYKYLCKDTIEERVKLLQDKKLDIANHVLTGTRSVSSKLTIEDLKLLFS